MKYYLLVAMLLSSYGVLAQNNAAKAGANSEVNSDTEMITVYGSKPLRYFKRAMDSEEKAFYKLFNSLVTDYKFKIRCHRTHPRATGSRIKLKECKPNYLKRKNTEEHFISHVNRPGENGSILVTDLYIQPNNDRYNKRIRKDHAELVQIATNLIDTNPSLKEQFYKYANAQKMYEGKRAEKFSTRQNSRIN